MMNPRPRIPDVKPSMRPPLKQVRLLLPVWGPRYIRQFLEVGLPTWLAPGNIPAVASKLPTEFVFLTNREGEKQLRRHQTVKCLADVVPVRYFNIDHLITNSNHSTSITLAYAEAVKEGGASALDTCFFFLVSDFLIADGSLRNALQRVIDGADGVQTGNFQVTAEDASPWLLARLRRSREVLALEPREMMRWGLDNLHPVTLANTVNIPDVYNLSSNRLFWHVDQNTIIGRFFLMHMLCIRPEVTDFEIGSSCDYSFIPEMCPSGRVEIISDSDEYLVIEMQPRAHEVGGLRLGRRKHEELARSLSEWTTAHHRRNAATTLIFHSENCPEGITRIRSEAEKYISILLKKMSAKPKPHRDHPYWRGAIASWKEATGKPLSAFEWRMMMGLTGPLARPDSKAELLKEWLLRFSGRPPNVKPWHPRWRDYQLLLERLEPISSEPSTRRLFIADRPTPFTSTMAPRTDTERMLGRVLLQKSASDVRRLAGKFDLCLIEPIDWDLEGLMVLIRRVLPMLKVHGLLLISLMGADGGLSRSSFAGLLASLRSTFMRNAPEAIHVTYLPLSGSRAFLLGEIRNLIALTRKNALLGLPLLVAVGPLLLATSWLANLVTRPRNELPKRGFVSSLIISIDAAAIRHELRKMPDRPGTIEGDHDLLLSGSDKLETQKV